MFNRQMIIKLIRESESDLKKQTQNMMNTKGVEFTAKLVGGVQNVAKILDLDLEDNETQCLLVKNFIYHFKIEGIDISFLKVRNSVSGKKIIKVYFTTYDNARNINSWYDRTISDYLNDSNLFPFKVGPAWEPVFANRGIKIFLESETINNENDED